MAESFDGAWIKWAWAIRHAQQLQSEIATFTADLDPDSLRVSVEYDAKRHGFPVVITDLPVLPIKCGVLLGDAVHNFRSALDHIAWAMVDRGRTPLSDLNEGTKRGIAFPLCDHKAARNSKDRTGWIKSSNRNLPGVRRADLALVRAYQPYRHGRRRNIHGLAILSALDNLDKHRTIQPLLTWPMGGLVEVRNWHHCEPTNPDSVVGKGGPLGVGAELFCIRVRKTGPDPKLDVYPRIAVEIAVYERILWQQWVNGIVGDIATLLHHLSDLPPDLFTRLGLTTIEI
jgi:hypothetical protein